MLALALVKLIVPESIRNGSESFSKFNGQQLCSSLTYRFYIILWKDLNPLSLYEVHKSGSNLRIAFALLKLPHLHRAYLVTVRFGLILPVQGLNLLAFMYLQQF